MKRRMMQLRIAMVSLGLLAACASRQHAAAGSANCTAKDGAKYDASSLSEVAARLERESAKVQWEDAPEPYRPWASAHLKQKLDRAAATLAQSSNCREVEAAASKLRPLAKRIAEAAKKCTDEQCLAKATQPTALDGELEQTLCPLYPFC